MEIVVDWLTQNLGTALSGACYIIAGVIFVWGMGSAISKLIGDHHSTGRDVMPQVALTAVATGIMYLAGTFAPSLLA